MVSYLVLVLCWVFVSVNYPFGWLMSLLSVVMLMWLARRL